MRKIAAIFLTCFLSFSCQKEFGIDLPEHEWKIVVEGYLTSGDSVLVRVNETRQYENQFSVDDPTRNGGNADVIVNVNGVDYRLQQYSLPPSSTLLYPTIYSLPASQLVVPHQGVLSLKVNYRGKSVISQSTVPLQPKIISFRTLPNKVNSKLFDLEIEAAFPSGLSYYLVQGSTETIKDTASIVMPFLSDIIVVEGNGEKKKIVVQNRGRGIVAIPQSPRRFILTLKRVNKEFYDFDAALRAQLDDLYGNKKLLGREITEIPSNISGGVGIFTAMSVDTLSVFP